MQFRNRDTEFWVPSHTGMYFSHWDHIYFHHLDSLLDGNGPAFKYQEETQKVTVTNTVSGIHLSLKVNKAHQEVH